MIHERNIKPLDIHPVFRRLTEARMAWKLSLEETSSRMGCDAQTLRKLELGLVSPSLGMLLRWSDVLGYEISLWPKRSA